MKQFLKTYKEHYKGLLLLGIPIVIGQVGVIILGFADTLMIGHHSTNELSAASFVNNMFNLAIIFSTGFSYGLTPIIGSMYGRSDLSGAGRVLKNSLVANFLVAIVLTAAMAILYLNIHRLGQPQELMPLIEPYYLILLASLVFVLLFNGFKQFTDGITDTRTSMWILLGGNVLNIAGNYILIYGKFGAPEMGLLGAGISTLASRIIMLLIFAGLFFYGKRFAPFLDGFKRLKINKADLLKLNAIGWPVALQMGMETASFSLSAIMIGWIGVIALASHQIMVTISTFSFMMYYGMGAAIAVKVSNFKGQNDWVNVRRSAYAGYHLITIMAITSSLLIFLLRNQLGGWFTDNEAVGVMVVTLIPPMLLYQLGDGMQIAFANALRGISDVKPMMIIAFISYFIISLPVGYFCAFILDWGAMGVWMAFPFGLTSAAVMLLFRFRKMTKNR